MPPAGERTPLDETAPVAIPVTWELDLHPFHPRDIATLIPAYLAECQAKDILVVRIIHGKGTGTLRTLVHATLPRCPPVKTFRPSDEQRGGWGATLVYLHSKKVRS